MSLKDKPLPERIAFPPAQATLTQSEGGSVILRNALALADYPTTVFSAFDKWVSETPDATFMAERSGADWARITYAQFAERIEQRARALLATPCAPDRPILIAAPNSIEHALTAFAAMRVGIPAAPVSPAYALLATDFERLVTIAKLLNPGAIFVGNPDQFGRAVPSLRAASDCPIFSHQADQSLNIFDIEQSPQAAQQAYEDAAKDIGPDTVAKILFTSGSTGTPKGVMNTHRMMVSNQAALAQLWPFLSNPPPVLVDWLPWSHTFGGNVCVNVALFHGGTFFIDDGKPAPQLIGRSVENHLLENANLHFNVPAGIEALLPHLERDAAYAKHFFDGLNAVFVAAAALPQKTRQRLQSVAMNAAGQAPTLLAGWGSTETAPFASCVYYPSDQASNIGLPMPGTEIKLTPDQDKLALRVRGPNVTPGYWRNDAATHAAFDEDGFYRMGDAGRLADPAAPSAGLLFDGRLSENFKLLSGTWVNVSHVRLGLISHLRPQFLDAVITGQNEPEIGALLVPSAAILEAFTPDMQQQIVDGVAKYNAANASSSTVVRRVAVLSRLPDISRNEITDKGYLNQRALLKNWESLVTQMYAEHREDDVMLFAP